MPFPIIAAAIAAIGGIQALSGAKKAKQANSDLDSFFKKRKAYKTPSEVFDILNLTTSNASQGFSDETNAYLTGQAGAGLSAGLGTAERLGADPNQLSGLLDSYYQDIFKIGNENELLKMRKFDSLTNAIGLVAQNKDAEWAGADNLIKDQMAAAAQRVSAGQQNIQSGINTVTSSLSTIGSSGLYGKNNSSTGNGTVAAKSGSATPPVDLSGVQGLTPSEKIKLKKLRELGLDV